MVVRGVDPDVLAGDPEGRRGFLQADVERHRRDTAVEAGEAGADRRGATADLAVGGEQRLVGEACADVGNDDRRLEPHRDRFRPASVHRLDPDGAAVADEDLGHLVRNPDLTAGRFDTGLEGAGDAAGAAFGVPGAPEIAGDHQRMESEGALPRWQPVVAPLRGEQGLQLRRAESAVEMLAGGAGGEIGAEAAIPTDETTERRRHHLLLEGEDVPPCGGAQVSEPAPDRRRLFGETLDQPCLVAFGIGRHTELEVGIDEALEVVGHAVPRERTTGKEVEQLSFEGSRLEIADIVQADVPGRAVATKDVGLPTSFEVLLQHQDALAGDPGEKPRRAQTADPRSDDDRIPPLGHGSSPKFHI